MPNGLITFDEATLEYLDEFRQPLQLSLNSSLSNVSVVAPYWILDQDYYYYDYYCGNETVRINETGYSGTIAYEIHQSPTEALDNVTNYVQDYTLDPTFEAAWMLLIQWRVSPGCYYDNDSTTLQYYNAVSMCSITMCCIITMTISHSVLLTITL